MDKLKLNLDDLRVESFLTTAGSSKRLGTVHGQTTSDGMDTCDPNWTYTCDTENTTWNVSAGCASQYDTCNCADESRVGYASCGTTCGYDSCDCTGNSGEPDTCAGSCQPDCGPTAPGMAC